MRGRPGVNPLTLRKDTILHVPVRAASAVAPRWRRAIGVRVSKGERLQLERGLRPNRVDLDANLAAIRAAAATAEVVVFSLHTHRHGKWLRETAHRAVEAGAAVVLVHGPHRVLGVELYRGSAIFYGLGDFAYEPHHIERFPARELSAQRARLRRGVAKVRAIVQHSGLAQKRETFEGCAAELSFVEGRVAGIRLLPLDLGFDLGPEQRGAAGARERHAGPAHHRLHGAAICPVPRAHRAGTRTATKAWGRPGGRPAIGISSGARSAYKERTARLSNVGVGAAAIQLHPKNPREGTMAESVYKVLELIGTSTKSWEDAAMAAVRRASRTLRDLRVAEVMEQDLVITDGKVEAFRTKLKVSFKYEEEAPRKRKMR